MLSMLSKSKTTGKRLSNTLTTSDVCCYLQSGSELEEQKKSYGVSRTKTMYRDTHQFREDSNRLLRVESVSAKEMRASATWDVDLERRNWKPRRNNSFSRASISARCHYRKQSNLWNHSSWRKESLVQKNSRTSIRHLSCAFQANKKTSGWMRKREKGRKGSIRKETKTDEEDKDSTSADLHVNVNTFGQEGDCRAQLRVQAATVPGRLQHLEPGLIIWTSIFLLKKGKVRPEEHAASGEKQAGNRRTHSKREPKFSSSWAGSVRENPPAAAMGSVYRERTGFHKIMAHSLVSHYIFL